MTKRDLLKLSDLSRDEINSLIEFAAELKSALAGGKSTPYLSGKSLGMLFKKSSTRTRISFEVGMFQLGGAALFLDAERLQLGRGETVADSARVFSRYLDGLVVRTYDQEEVEELAKVAKIPVINALTDLFHPCQILADLLTITEKKGALADVKLVYVGDGNNIANSWLLGASIMGMTLTVATPTGYEPSADILKEAKREAAVSGATIKLINDPMEAVEGADVIYTDTWISMGQDEEADVRRRDFDGFCVNSKMVGKADEKVIVMHCLPAHRGEEISDDVLDGAHSVVWDQAENRLHAQKALLVTLMGDKNQTF